MKLADKIKDYGAEIALDEVKITTANDLIEVREFMESCKKEGQLSKFVKDDLAAITSPTEVLASAQSIIVVAMSYYNRGDSASANGLQGKMSRFARGQDYHQVLGAKLEQLENFLSRLKPQVETHRFVDTGPTVDRALARRAGIGWQGKNCSIIHPDYGSWIFIGGIITNLELESDSAIEDKCGDCTRCLDNCPTGALQEKYLLDAKECLGYITLSKGYLEEQHRKQIDNRLWGCDTCQDVCPYNQDVKAGNHLEFRENDGEAYPDLLPLLELTNDRFKKRFGSTALNWRGKRPLKRNAAVILGNLQSTAALPGLIATLKEDPQAIVRGHCAWALGEIASLVAKRGLEEALVTEKEERVRSEIKQALANS
ncbi:MAG: tRNA epoxyqueuosine(34) reductase QueG [Bacillota bacterium]